MLLRIRVIQQASMLELLLVYCLIVSKNRPFSVEIGWVHFVFPRKKPYLRKIFSFHFDIAITDLSSFVYICFTSYHANNSQLCELIILLFLLQSCMENCNPFKNLLLVERCILSAKNTNSLADWILKTQECPCENRELLLRMLFFLAENLRNSLACLKRCVRVSWQNVGLLISRESWGRVKEWRVIFFSLVHMTAVAQVTCHHWEMSTESSAAVSIWHAFVEPYLSPPTPFHPDATLGQPDALPGWHFW